MAEEISTIGVKLTLNASQYMAGMGAAADATNNFVAAAEKASTVAGQTGGAGRKSGSKSSAAPGTAVPLDLSVSSAQISKLRKQIIEGIGVIPIQLAVGGSAKAIRGEAEKVVAAQITPSVGTRSGAAHAVRSAVKQNLPERAYGGPVQQGRSYVVGERRAEVFTPRQTGYVHADAERFYREQERLERQHQARMRRMAGGPAEPMGPLQRRIAGLPPLETRQPAPPPQEREPEWLRRAREQKLPPKVYRRNAGYVRPSRSLESRALRMFGETDEIMEAGYVSPSGRFLDFSGRHEASGYRRQGNRFVPESRRHPDDYLYGSRNTDHRQAWPLFKGLNGPEAMQRMMNRGYVRVFSADYDQRQFMGEIVRPMTDAQRRAIMGGMPSGSTAILDVSDRRGRRKGMVGDFMDGLGDAPAVGLGRGIQIANEIARRRRHMGGIAHAAKGRLDVSGIEPNFRKFMEAATPEQFTEGAHWYQAWGRELRAAARVNHLDPKILAAVTAQLSPNNGWPGNFHDAVKYAEAWRKGLPMPGSSSFGANQKKAWALLQQQQSAISGLKISEFSEALLGRASAKPMDLWMKRAAVGNLQLPRSKGTPSPGQRREMNRVTDLLAAEYNLEPRQVQAIIWTVAREQGMAERGALKHARLRGAGGGVLGTFREVAPFIGQAIAGGQSPWQAVAGQAPFIIQKYVAEHLRHARRGQRDVVGKPRPGIDVVGPPIMPLPPQLAEILQYELGPTGRSGKLFDYIMAGEAPSGLDWLVHQNLPRLAKPHHLGGIVRADGGARTRTISKSYKVRPYGKFTPNPDYKPADQAAADRAAKLATLEGSISGSPMLVYDTLNPRAESAKAMPTEPPPGWYAAGEEGPSANEFFAAQSDQAKIDKRNASGAGHTYGSLFAGRGHLNGPDGAWYKNTYTADGPQATMYSGKTAFGLFSEPEYGNPKNTKKWLVIKTRPVGADRIATGEWSEPILHPISKKVALGMSLDTLETALSLRGTPQREGQTYREHLEESFGQAAILDHINVTGKVSAEDAAKIMEGVKAGSRFVGATDPAEAHTGLTRDARGRLVLRSKAAPVHHGAIKNWRLSGDYAPPAMVAGPKPDLGTTVKNNRRDRAALAEAISALEAVPFTAGDMSGQRHDELRRLWDEAKRLREDGSKERIRRLLDPWAEAELNSENKRRAGRGAVPLTMADVGFDPDNMIFHASEPETMSRFRVRQGKKKGGGPGEGANLEVDIRPWESILDEGGSWRWLAENDPEKVLKVQRRRLETLSHYAADDPMAQAWYERQKAEARETIKNYEALQKRIASGDLDWKGAAGLPSKEAILPELEQAEANYAHDLEVNAKQGGMEAHLKEGRREVEVMRALWAKAGGEPRGELAELPKRTRSRATAEAKIVAGPESTAYTRQKDDPNWWGGLENVTVVKGMTRANGPETLAGFRNGEPVLVFARQNAPFRPDQGVEEIPFQGGTAHLIEGPSLLSSYIGSKTITSGKNKGTNPFVETLPRDWRIAEQIRHFADLLRSNPRTPSYIEAKRLLDTGEEPSPEFVAHLLGRRGTSWDDKDLEAITADMKTRERDKKRKLTEINKAAAEEAKAKGQDYDPRFVSVPQHEAPEVIAHAKIAEDALARRAAREAEHAKVVAEAVAAQPEEPHTTRTKVGWPKSAEELVTERASRISREQADAARKRMESLGLFTVTRHHRAGGGPADEGLYIVNEAGPEAFLTNADAHKLGMVRPDIMARVPHASDGARTGMIQKPAWSLFAPQQSGIIVRREDAQAALQAVRAQHGIHTDQDRFEATGPLIAGPREPFTPTGPITAAPSQRRRLTADEEVAAAAQKLAAALQKATATIEGATQRTGHIGQVPLLGGPHEIEQHALVRPGQYTPTGPIVNRAGVAMGTPLITPNRQIIMPQPLVNAAGEELGISRTPPPPAAPRRAPRASAEYLARAARARSPEAEAAMAEYRASLSGKSTLGPRAPFSREGQGTIGYYRSQVQHQKEMEGDYEGDALLAQQRVKRAGVSAIMTERTQKGVAAVYGALTLGGGMAFKQRQAEYQNERANYMKISAAYKRTATDVDALKEALDSGELSDEDAESARTRLAEKSEILAKQEKIRAGAVEKLAAAEAKAQPGMLDAVRNFGGIILSTSAYGAAMAVASKLLEAGSVELGKFADSMMSFGATNTRVTKELGAGILEAGGNVQAAFGKAAQAGGVGGAGTAYLQRTLGPAATAKAASQAEMQASGLFRAASGQGAAPEGLYHGYGGLFNTSFLAGMMGGGPGFSESVAGNVEALGGAAQRARDDAARAAGPAVPAEVVARARTGESTPEDMTAYGDFFTKLGEERLNTRTSSPELYAKAAQGDKEAQGQIRNAEVDRVQAAAASAPSRAGADTTASAFTAYITDINEAAQRGAASMGEAGKAFKFIEVAANDSRKSAFEAAAQQAGDLDNAKKLTNRNQIIVDAAGNVVTDAKAYEKAWNEIATGRTIVSMATYANQIAQSMRAQFEQMSAMGSYQLQTAIPLQLGQQLAAQPFLPAEAGVLPTTEKANVSPETAGKVGKLIADANKLQADLTKQGQAAVTAEAGFIREQAVVNPALDDMAKGMGLVGSSGAKINTAADAYTYLMDTVSASGKVIAGYQTDIVNAQTNASFKAYANNLRLANRALADAAGLAGQANGSALGAMQRAQQMLSFMLSQKQINFQVAMAGFQAPGLTSEERGARQAQAQAEASVAQQQLNLSIGIFGQQVAYGLADAKAARSVMVAEHDAQVYVASITKRIAAEQAKQSQALAKAGVIVQGAEGTLTGVLSAATTYVSQFGGSVRDATDQLRAALGLSPIDRGTRSEREAARAIHPTATGFLGSFAKGAVLQVGEAGPETVAILRNPRAYSPMGGGFGMGGGGGGGGGSTVNLYLTVQGDVKDEATVAKIVRAVEDSFNRKAARIGMRSYVSATG